MQDKNVKIYIAGSGGMVGSAIRRNLENSGYTNIVGRTSNELNLIRQAEVEDFFAEERPEIVIHSAGRVGGIMANDTFRAEFIYNNLMMEANVIAAAHQNDVKKLIFLGSSCIYPKLAPQPISEEDLLTGYLEPTNEPYAVAKIAGIKLCENFHRQYGSNFYSVMPTNLYGINDTFDAQHSHVIPALICKIHAAKINRQPTVTLWGTGTPRREFMYVEDLAQAVIFMLENVDAKDVYAQNITHINIGVGADIAIRQLAETLVKIIGYEGALEFDTSKPDGTPRKLLNVDRLRNLGWQKNTPLEEGLRTTYEWFLQNKAVAI